VYILQRLAERLGAPVVFTPAYKVADAKSGLRVAISYLMHLDDEGKCPFLEGTSCMVHGLYKPLTCRSSISTEGHKIRAEPRQPRDTH